MGVGQIRPAVKSRPPGKNQTPPPAEPAPPFPERPLHDPPKTPADFRPRRPGLSACRDSRAPHLPSLRPSRAPGFTPSASSRAPGFTPSVSDRLALFPLALFPGRATGFSLPILDEWLTSKDMNTLRTIALALLLLVFPAALSADAPEPELTPPGEDIAWMSPEPGLDMARLSYTRDRGDDFSRRLVIRVLRFDTAYFDFHLFSSRWEGSSVPTMREWADNKNLTAAINASMYLKDGLTSTGYMRSGSRTNNSRIVSRYGAFFVAGPKDDSLPRAAVLDRSVDDWQNLLPRYDIVVQNFRLMGPDGQQIWPEHGPEHAIAAIAEDMNGRILFLHCADPASVHDFVEALNAHKNLNLNSAMYVEGGSEASLLLRLPRDFHVWNGMSPASYMFSSRGDAIPLPNILGAVQRTQK